MEWLEEEGERRRRPAPLPPQVGDPAVRGWVQAGVCVLVGTITAGLFVCWLPRVWPLADRQAILSPWLAKDAKQGVGVGGAVTVRDGVVVGVFLDDQADGGPRPLTLIVFLGGKACLCEFRASKAPRALDLRVGDTISIRSAAWWFEENMDRMVLKDCEVAEVPRRHWFPRMPRPEVKP
jgi:hypothetical protein